MEKGDPWRGKGAHGEARFHEDEKPLERGEPGISGTHREGVPWRGGFMEGPRNSKGGVQSGGSRDRRVGLEECTSNGA